MPRQKNTQKCCVLLIMGINLMRIHEKPESVLCACKIWGAKVPDSGVIHMRINRITSFWACTWPLINYGILLKNLIIKQLKIVIATGAGICTTLTSSTSTIAVTALNAAAATSLPATLSVAASAITGCWNPLANAPVTVNTVTAANALLACYVN